MANDKVALVSGGNRGMGLETCRRLADFGYRVLLGSRDPDAGAAVEALLRENHERARALLVALIRSEPSVAVPGELLEPVAEHFRSAAAGLALWWSEHPEVPRARLVRTALLMQLGGLERASR